MKQIEITRKQDLLNDLGHIVNEGWARQPYWLYDRNKIKAPWFRIKEWDYYAVINHRDNYGITFTVADLGFVGLAVICWLDFDSGTFSQADCLTPLPRGSMLLPPSSNTGSISFQNKKMSIGFELSKGTRHITADTSPFKINGKKSSLKGELKLHQPPLHDSMVIATSWEENRKAFYYNQKVNCMPAEGSIYIGSDEYAFSPDTSFAVLDWGRGNWTYKNRWYWSSLSSSIDGIPFGLNLGYGFSDRSSATENMLFYDGKAHKLGDVAFHFDENNYLSPWKISDNEGRLDMNFIPTLDRNSTMNLLILKSIQHQVFGRFSGTAALDSGKVLEINDTLGFAEDVLNWL